MIINQKFNRMSVGIMAELAAQEKLTSDEPGYWTITQAFWDRIKDKDHSTLTDRQLNYVRKIERDLIEEAKKGS